MSREHTFVDDPVAVVERTPSRREAHLTEWSRFTLHWWDDLLLERHGHLLTSAYVETYWLPIIGPTSLCMVRNLTHRHPPCEVVLAELAGEMGTKPAQALRTLERLGRFGFLQMSQGAVLVHDRAHTLSARQVELLPEHLAVRHRRVFG